METWPPCDPASFRHWIVIQALSQTQGQFNQPELAPLTVRSCWASIGSVTDNEKVSEGQATSQITHLIFVRWTPVVLKAGMQIAFGSHVYKIQDVNNLMMRNEFIRLRCLELNATS